jgi:hypothetical protein
MDSAPSTSDVGASSSVGAGSSGGASVAPPTEHVGLGRGIASRVAPRTAVRRSSLRRAGGPGALGASSQRFGSALALSNSSRWALGRLHGDAVTASSSGGPLSRSSGTGPSPIGGFAVRPPVSVWPAWADEPEDTAAVVRRSPAPAAPAPPARREPPKSKAERKVEALKRLVMGGGAAAGANPTGTSPAATRAGGAGSVAPRPGAPGSIGAPSGSAAATATDGRAGSVPAPRVRRGLPLVVRRSVGAAPAGAPTAVPGGAPPDVGPGGAATPVAPAGTPLPGRMARTMRPDPIDPDVVPSRTGRGIGDDRPQRAAGAGGAPMGESPRRRPAPGRGQQRDRGADKVDALRRMLASRGEVPPSGDAGGGAGASAGAAGPSGVASLAAPTTPTPRTQAARSDTDLAASRLGAVSTVGASVTGRPDGGATSLPLATIMRTPAPSRAAAAVLDREATGPTTGDATGASRRPATTRRPGRLHRRLGTGGVHWVGDPQLGHRVDAVDDAATSDLAVAPAGWVRWPEGRGTSDAGSATAVRPAPADPRPDVVRRSPATVVGPATAVPARSESRSTDALGPGERIGAAAAGPGAGDVLARPGSLFAAQGNMTGFARWPLLRRGTELSSAAGPDLLDVASLAVGPVAGSVTVTGAAGASGVSPAGDPTALMRRSPRDTAPAAHLAPGRRPTTAPAPGSVEAGPMAADARTAPSPAAVVARATTTAATAAAVADPAAGSTPGAPRAVDASVLRPRPVAAPEVLGEVAAGPGLVRRHPVVTPTSRVVTAPWGPFGRPVTFAAVRPGAWPILGQDPTGSAASGTVGPAAAGIPATSPSPAGVVRRSPIGQAPTPAPALGAPAPAPAPSSPVGRIARDAAAATNRPPMLPGLEPGAADDAVGAGHTPGATEPAVSDRPVRPGQVVIQRSVDPADVPAAAGTAAAGAAALAAGATLGRSNRPAGDELADRFLAELASRPRTAPYELPRHARPLAAAIVGDRPVRISTDATTRAALRSVGKRAATAGDVVHLDRPLGTGRDDLAVLAHELTHVAHPSPAPRFFDDDRRGPEERQAEEMAEIIRRNPARPTGPRRPDAPQIGSQRGRSSARPVAPPPRAGSASGSAPAPAPPRPSTPPPGTFSASAMAAQITGGSAGPDPLTPVVHQTAPPAPDVTASSSSSLSSSDSGAAERSIGVTLDQLDRLVEMLQDRIIVELERRGGRNRGGF